MHYLEQVINETLRMYPPATRIERTANEDYEFNGIKIEKEKMVWFSVWSLHHDPEIYPEPYKFDPSRFDEQSKKTRDNMAFIPFGSGPRSCIGYFFEFIFKKAFILVCCNPF